MGSTTSTLSARLYTLILSFVLLAAFGSVQAQSEGMQAAVDHYILPQYREKDNRLDYIIYGDNAENRGALLHLEKVKVDILNTEGNGIYNLKDADIYYTASRSKKEKVPDPYNIDATIKARREFVARLLKNNHYGNVLRNIAAENNLIKIREQFWKINKKQKNVNAWIYSDAGVYDKNARILRSDDGVPAYFRSRDVDVNGIGFDAYNQKVDKRNKNTFNKRRFIHIRSNVRIINYAYEKDAKDTQKADTINFIALSDNMDIDNNEKERVILTLRKNVCIENITEKDFKMKVSVRDGKKTSEKEVDAIAITQITCDKMVINSKMTDDDDKKEKKKDNADRLKKIEFFENVVMTRLEIPVDAKYAAFAKKQVVTCNYAIYDMEELKATLKGNPVLTSGRDRITGEQIEIFMKKVEADKKSKKEKKKSAKLEPVRVRIKLPVITYYGDNQPEKGASANKKQTPYHVESDTLDYDIEKQICTLWGNVICEQKANEIKVIDKVKIPLQHQNRISCNKMMIYLEDKPVQGTKSDKDGSGGRQLKQIECFDDVVITRKVDPLDPAKKYRKYAKKEASESDYAKFDNKDQRLTLTGRPIVTSNKDLLKGEKIEVVFEKGVSEADKEQMVAQNIIVHMPDLTYFGDTQLSKEQTKDKKDAADKSSLPSYISAELMDYDIRQDICTLQYNVQIKETKFDTMTVNDPERKTIKRKIETELQCEKLCLHLKNAPKTSANNDETKKELKTLECFRDVVITRKITPLDPNYANYAEFHSSTSDYAEYNLKKNLLFLDQKPVLRNGKNQLRGEKMEIFLKKKESKGTSVAQNMDFDPKNVKVYMPILHYNENTSPVMAESNIMHYDTKTDICTLLGNVVVDDRDNARITCDKMLIHLENAPVVKTAVNTEKQKKDKQDDTKKQLKLLECFGEVNITHRASADKRTTHNRTSVSDYAVYDPQKLTMKLTGKPVMNSGGDVMSGEQIDIFFAEDEEEALRAKSDRKNSKLKIKNVKVSMPVVNYRGSTKMPKGKK